MLRQRFVALLAMVSLAAACSDTSNSNTPTAPSSSGTAAGALVSGIVQRTAAAAGAALTVQVTGTSLSAAVSAANQFSLSNVPAGPVELRFSAPGVDARVAVGSVSAGDSLNLVIEVSSSNAVVRSDSRNSGSGNGGQRDDDDDDDDDNDDDEFEGRIQSITGTVPNLTLVVNGRTVRTTSATVVRRRGNVVGLAFLAVQQEVEIDGRQPSGTGPFEATRITVEDEADDDDDDEDEVRATGSIGSLSSVGGCPAVTFSAGGVSWVTNARTDFRLSCSALRNGDRVEVRGNRSSASGPVTATRVRRDD